MTLRRETPHVAACCRDGSWWLLPMGEHQSFRAAWMRGEAFWDGRDLYDSVVTIKLGDITGLVVRDAARLALLRDEEEEERLRGLTEL